MTTVHDVREETLLTGEGRSARCADCNHWHIPNDDAYVFCFLD
jgi:hypothetical protein